MKNVAPYKDFFLKSKVKRTKILRLAETAMMLLMVGLISCLGARLIWLYISQLLQSPVGSSKKNNHQLLSSTLQEQSVQTTESKNFLAKPNQHKIGFRTYESGLLMFLNQKSTEVTATAKAHTSFSKYVLMDEERPNLELPQQLERYQRQCFSVEEPCQTKPNSLDWVKLDIHLKVDTEGKIIGSLRTKTNIISEKQNQFQGVGEAKEVLYCVHSENRSLIIGKLINKAKLQRQLMNFLFNRKSFNLSVGKDGVNQKQAYSRREDLGRPFVHQNLEQEGIYVNIPKLFVTSNDSLPQSRRSQQMAGKIPSQSDSCNFECLRNGECSEDVLHDRNSPYLTVLLEVQRLLLNSDTSTSSYSELLNELGNACNASSISIFENQTQADSKELTIVPYAAWQKSDSVGVLAAGHINSLFPRWQQRLGRGEIISGTVADYDPREREVFVNSGILAILILPILGKAKLNGFLVVTESIETRSWHLSEVKFLQTAATAIALAWERSLSENALQAVIDQTCYFTSFLETRVQERTAELQQEIASKERIQEELEKSLSLQAATLESTADGILVVDNQGNLAGYNQKFLQMWRLDESLMTPVNMKQALRVGLRQLKEPKKYLDTVRQLRDRPNAQINDLIAFRDGRVFERYSQPQRIGGKIFGRVWSFRDVSDRFLAEAKIRYQALHDLLTDLPNRVLFNQRLAESLATAATKNSQLAVCFLDLDRFKTINDTLGHAVGDKLLQSVAQSLSNSLQPGDTIARWGGDEFTILLTASADKPAVAKRVEEILAALKPGFDIENHNLHISGSIGVALYPTHGEDAETLIKNADAALYRAKSRGRNSYQFYNSNINSQASELLILENSLYHALERQEFIVYYQPQVNITTGRITQMEALVRWQHPQLGLIPPTKFIPIAEETGLIETIGEWVLKSACAQTKAWQQALSIPSLSIAVNLSARQFQQPNLVSIVRQALEETKLAPQCLELEITESIAMQNVDFTKTILMDLDSMGVSISIDDFGTGYCSLSYLKKFPIHNLKIDKSFVRDLTGDSNDAAITTAIIALARGLNLGVVAEGVETEEQRNYLKRLECEIMQGYLFSRPVSAEDATKILLHSQSSLRRSRLAA